MGNRSGQSSPLFSSLVRRRTLDKLLDRLRFKIDTTSRSGNYQPLPAGVAGNAYRGDSTRARWDAIKPVLAETEVQTAVDVGCNAGFFPLELSRLGVDCVGIEGEAVKFRTFAYAAEHFGSDGSISQMRMFVTPSTVSFVPASDATLVLSIWHHFVQKFGFEDASSMLTSLWERTGKVLFFETGQQEAAEQYHLPAMGDDPQAWLFQYLTSTCAGGDVRYIGEQDAMAPDGSPCTRSMFAIVRLEKN